MKLVSSLDEKEAQALEVAKQKAKEYELFIKIIDIEYLFDTSKLNIFYKVSKGKKTPNLKPYRKDLSSSLKAEVTMRSITPRDEAKFLGGLGPCGRPLCCTKWLNKPKHITVKMVKEQGFQISPTRTSGMCGRLMCCFEYEQEAKKGDKK
jgi:cell fate regulator YaaT (PSP1 superfamily)